MAGDAYLLDSNILIRWVQRQDPGAPAVVEAIDLLLAADADLFYTSQNLGEFWNVLTRPANRNGYGLTPDEAHRRTLKIESRLQLLADGPDVHREWRRLLVAYRVSGVQVHDARLVSAMLVYGVKRILTFNTKDFARFDKIEAIHPADVG